VKFETPGIPEIFNVQFIMRQLLKQAAKQPLKQVGRTAAGTA
jgi:hypothetical protein